MLCSLQVVRQIDSHTDIVYNSTGVAGGGMVSCRYVAGMFLKLEKLAPLRAHFSLHSWMGLRSSQFFRLLPAEKVSTDGLKNI